MHRLCSGRGQGQQLEEGGKEAETKTKAEAKGEGGREGGRGGWHNMAYVRVCFGI